MNVLTLVGTWWHVGRIGQCNVSSPILINSKTTGMKIIPSVETSNCAFGKKKKLIEDVQKSSSQTFWRISECAELNLTDWKSIFVLFCQKDLLKVYVLEKRLFMLE